MKNLTTPHAILLGLFLIALAIASIPYSSNFVKPALADGHIQKVAFCSLTGKTCAAVFYTDGNGGLVGVYTPEEYTH